MRVISKPALRDFWQQHPRAEKPLTEWYKTAEKASWESIADVRQTYPNADAVTLESGETVTVFNIGGNKFRLVARIVYRVHLVYVKLVLTHAEYDLENWKVQLCH